MNNHRISRRSFLAARLIPAMTARRFWETPYCVRFSLKSFIQSVIRKWFPEKSTCFSKSWRILARLAHHLTFLSVYATIK